MGHVKKEVSETNQSYGLGILLFTLLLAIIALGAWSLCGTGAGSHGVGHGHKAAAHTEKAMH